MTFLRIRLLLSLLSISSFTWADDAAEAEAEKLLSVMNMEKVMDESITQMVDVQLQQQPTLAPFKSVMLKFFKKHMSWESLKFEMVYIYSKTFTAQELNELTAFYSTPTGKKAIEKMPTLMAQGAQVGAARIQENMSELQAMIKEESVRLQRLAEQ